MTEHEFETECLRLIVRFSFEVRIVPDSRRLIRQLDGKFIQVGVGWPDLEIIGRIGILYRELKIGDAELASDQKRIRYALQGAGANWAIWRPAHLWSGQIEAELRQIA